MNVDELKKAIRVIQEKEQDEFINKLKNDIDWFLEKANAKDYEPTEHERIVFNEIKTIIDNMNKWF